MSNTASQAAIAPGLTAPRNTRYVNTNPREEVFSSRAAGRDGKNHLFGFVDWRDKLVAVEYQESFHCRMTDSLVPVDEGMIVNEREAKGRCLLPDTSVQVAFAEGHAGLSNGCFEGTEVSHAGRAAGLGDHAPVQVEDLGE